VIFLATVTLTLSSLIAEVFKTSTLTTVKTQTTYVYSCCPLVSRGEYADEADTQTNGRTDARPLHYAFRYGCGKRNASLFDTKSEKNRHALKTNKPSKPTTKEANKYMRKSPHRIRITRSILLHRITIII